MVCIGQILEKDTLKSFERYDTILYTVTPTLFQLQKVDTTIANFHQYNPALAKNESSLYLGNIGQATLPLVFDYTLPIGFQLGINTFTPYFFGKDEVKYFNSPHPFTEVGYVLGSSDEQVVKAQFGQNIGQFFNYHLDYRRITSPGLYQRQNAGYHNFAASTWYHSNGQNYNLLASYLHNAGDIEQNGGINFTDNDELFEDDIINKSIVPVSLTNATTKVKENNFFVQQSYDWGDYEKKRLNDSLSYYQLIPKFRVGHQLNYTTFSYNYTDESPNAIFYNQTLISSDRTDDVLQTTQLSNEIFATWLGRGVKKDTLQTKKSDAYLTTSFEHQKVKLVQLGRLQQLDTTAIARIDTTLNLQTGLAKFYAQNASASRLHYQLTANYALFGYNATDFSIDGKVRLKFSDKLGHLEGGVTTKRLFPSQFNHFYFGNHHQWELNNLNKTNSLQFLGKYVNPSFKLTFTYLNHTLNNYIIWEEKTNGVIQPTQLDEVINISQFVLTKNFLFGKFHIDNTLTFQISTSDKIRLPKLYTAHNLYFQGNLFKNALLAKIGVAVSYNTNYRGYAYAPSISQFYIPQTDETLRYYPVIEPFLTAKIKRVRIFGKLQHVNQSLFKSWQGYFAAIDHPMPDRIFKVGVSWYFYD